MCAFILGAIAQSSWDASDHLLHENLLPILLREFRNETATNYRHITTHTMLILCSSEPAPSLELISPIVPFLVSNLLTHQDPVIVTGICLAITKLLSFHKFPELLTSNLWRSIVRLPDRGVRLGNTQLQNAALGLVRQMTLGDESQIDTLISCGVLTVLIRILSGLHGNDTKCEACKILSSIVCRSPKLIDAIVQAGAIELLQMQFQRYSNHFLGEEAALVIVNMFSMAI